MTDRQMPWRIFLNGKFSHVAYAATAHEALAAENQRLGVRAAVTEIKVNKVNSSTD